MLVQYPVPVTVPCAFRMLHCAAIPFAAGGSHCSCIPREFGVCTTRSPQIPVPAVPVGAHVQSGWHCPGHACPATIPLSHCSPEFSTLFPHILAGGAVCAACTSASTFWQVPDGYAPVSPYACMIGSLGAFEYVCT